MSYQNLTRAFLPVVLILILSACGGGSGDAPPPPPTATTAAATEISLHTATLNGTVNPHAQATNAWFEWGTDNALVNPTLTTTQAIGSGSADNSVSAAITGLTFGTTYYYRVVAMNASGTQRGAIASFTTALPNSPPSVTTNAATSVTISGGSLNGTVSPNELGTTAVFEWGTDSNLATFTTTSSQDLGAGTTSVAITASLTGLNPGVKYYFRVVATNSAGTTTGSIVNFTAVAQAPTVATAAADNISVTGATLHGTVNPNGLAVTDAHFEYGTSPTLATFTSTGVQPLAAGFSAQPITALPSGLTPGMTYYFRVAATNSAGTTTGLILSFSLTTVFFFDDFSTDTTGAYTVVGPGSTFAWDNVGHRARLVSGGIGGLTFSHSTPALDNGVFSIDFNPTTPFYGTHGGFWIRLMQDANNYYEVSNFDWGGGSPSAPDVAAVRKFVGGSATPVDEQLFTTGYSQDATYNIKITFSPTQVKLEGFGAPIVLNTSDTTAISVVNLQVETGNQDVYYDNILLVAGP